MTLTRYQAFRARARAAVRPISALLRAASVEAGPFFPFTVASPSSALWLSASSARSSRRAGRTRLTAALAIGASVSCLMLTSNAHAQGAPETPSHGQVFEEEIVPQRYANNPAVNSFIDDLVARYDFNADTLHAIFNQVSYSATAVKLVTPSPNPSVKNWQSYQSRFIEPIRVNGGVKFWRANQQWLDRASQTYGVPPEIVVAIIGVETLYGKYTGNFRVLDALTTLAFDYPNTPNRDAREQLFRKNLEDFLVWTHTSNIDPSSVQGSYAGAIGIAQFMPSSILQYAVDFDGSQQIDLRNSPADAIGSVANFLKQSGWEAGRPVMWQIGPDVGSLGIAQAAADGKPEPHWALNQLLKAGMVLNEPGLNTDSELGTPVTVVDLPTPGQPTQYALGLQNFYAITRYNRSFFYATTVYQLAQAIKAKLQASGGLPPTPPTSVGSAGDASAASDASGLRDMNTASNSPTLSGAAGASTTPGSQTAQTHLSVPSGPVTSIDSSTISASDNAANQRASWFTSQ